MNVRSNLRQKHMISRLCAFEDYQIQSSISDTRDDVQSNKEQKAAMYPPYSLACVEYLQQAPSYQSMLV